MKKNTINAYSQGKDFLTPSSLKKNPQRSKDIGIIISHKCYINCHKYIQWAKGNHGQRKSKWYMNKMKISMNDQNYKKKPNKFCS